jgi:hypothetical protein
MCPHTPVLTESLNTLRVFKLDVEGYSVSVSELGTEKASLPIRTILQGL